MEAPADVTLGKLSLQDALTKKAESISGGLAFRPASDRRKAAQEFSSLLFLEVLKAMRAATPPEGLFENEALSRDVYTAMMDTEIARVMAQRDTTGFTQMVEKSLDKTTAQPQQPNQLHDAAHGVVSSAFGMRTDPFNGSVKFHQGVDIAAPAGTPVKAAADGKVVFSGQLAGYGNLVEVDHGNGWVTRYGHNAANLVAAGAEVKAGQTVGLVGSTGRATGPHVHFEVRKAGKAVNPDNLLGGVIKGSRVSSIV
jgi:murein DD-endopeptidase MepM/ murein hydrolase activator NlpD